MAEPATVTRVSSPAIRYRREHYPTYNQWQQVEGVPSVSGHFVDDLRTIELYPWPRKRGRGVFINLSHQEITDAFVMEIPPTGSTPVQHHFFEELCYVLSGRGATSVWNEGGDPVKFEWQTGSLFAVPLNAHHQHFNLTGDTAARMLCTTNAPMMMNTFQDEDFIFNCPYSFRSRFSGDKEFFKRPLDRADADGIPGFIIETNLIPDVYKVEAPAYTRAGKGNSSTHIWMANTSMRNHIAIVEAGTYRKAHKHGAGAHIYILDGHGYSMMWKPGDTPQRFEWKEGSFISPPSGWYHQHFNTSATPIRQLAFHRPHSLGSDEEGGDLTQIEYEHEDPMFRELYEKELARNGVQSRM